MLCCGYTLTDFPISIRLTSLTLWQSNDCPGASKATLMNMDKYFMWIHYERLHNHNKAKHNKTVCIFLGMYCMDAYGIEAWTNPRSLDETFWCILLKGLCMIQYSHKSIFINICLIIGRPRDNQTALVQSVAWDKGVSQRVYHWWPNLRQPCQMCHPDRIILSTNGTRVVWIDSFIKNESKSSWYFVC